MVDPDYTATIGLDRDQVRALVPAADADRGPQALRTAAVVRLLVHNAEYPVDQARREVAQLVTATQAVASLEGPECRALSGAAPPTARHLKILSNRSAERIFRAHLARGASTAPAGLPARDRPKARPEMRAANLRGPRTY